MNFTDYRGLCGGGFWSSFFGGGSRSGGGGDDYVEGPIFELDPFEVIADGSGDSNDYTQAGGYTSIDPDSLIGTDLDGGGSSYGGIGDSYGGGGSAPEPDKEKKEEKDKVYTLPEFVVIGQRYTFADFLNDQLKFELSLSMPYFRFSPTGSGSGSNDKETAEEREKRKKRCNQLKSAWASALRTQLVELAIIADYKGKDTGVYLRMLGDTAAFLESSIDWVAKSPYPILDSIKDTRGLEFANDMTNGFAVVVGAIDILNAYGAFQGNSENGYKPDWGGVSFNLGSAGANALSLYLGSPVAKGFASNPGTGVLFGTGVLAISFGQELILNSIANDGIREAEAGYNNAIERSQQIRGEFFDLNCFEFFGSDK